jgi:hypothetical protein
MMGYRRDSFYRFKELHDAGGELALQALTRRKPILKNRTPPDVEAIIVELSLERPAYGQLRIADELRKLGHSISPAGVRGVWQRHDLETMKKRLKASKPKSLRTAWCSAKANWRRWRRPRARRRRAANSRASARTIAELRTPSTKTRLSRFPLRPLKRRNHRLDVARLEASFRPPRQARRHRAQQPILAAQLENRDNRRIVIEGGRGRVGIEHLRHRSLDL